MPTFDDLWANHPARQIVPEIEPCKKGGISNFSNQCAIRLGVTFTASGISLASYRGHMCWYGHGRAHPLRVEELKLWINSDAATFAPNYAEKYVKDKEGKQKTFANFIGRQGIVAFLDFWGTGNNGDHIDLWNGHEIAHGENDYFERSRELWFWAIP